MDDITGKVALVTGGSRGIGRAIAVALARAGADVAVNYVASRRDADAAVAEIQALGRRAVALGADVGQPEQASALVGAAERALGPVGILVNSAGVGYALAIEDITPEIWNRTLAINLTGSFLVTQAAVPAMRRARWGRIMAISSVAAQTGGVIGPHYAASKAGQIGLMHSYARRLAGDGITANAIAPGRIDTDIVRQDTSALRATAPAPPVGRIGTADEVAAVAVMLAHNGYITGQTININGGVHSS
ncbi:MAG: SDR family NAD(P)-dependent oxidoreductase [Proteobacteria bacterium]|nr:SDR family NAD(P)-dependent oxidoreductase [Pseudomonadota bacterium]